jgi:uncharacterized protein (TIGR03067 family)
MKFRIALGIGLGLLAGANVAAAEKSLQGTWKLVKGEANGVELSKQQLHDGKLVIEGDHYEVWLEGKSPLTGVQVLGAENDLKTIDISDDSGPGVGQSSLGIYELEGDEFRVIFAPPGKERPTEMTTTADSGCWLHVWKREKANEKK